MILVLAGTQDGRELSACLAAAGFSVLVSVVSDYGRKLAAQDTLATTVGAKDAAALATLLTKNGIRAVIDVSHPYATAVSHNAQEACAATGAAYLRYERESSPLPAYSKLHVVGDAAEAAKVAAGLGQVVFLTTGSRSLAVFKTEPLLQDHRLIIRVLPEPAVIAECVALGFLPKDIVALQGPFSVELNVALFREYNSEVIVTKNSGPVGGTDTKLAAAMALQLPVVVIDRPLASYSRIAYRVEDVIHFLEEVAL